MKKTLFISALMIMLFSCLVLADTTTIVAPASSGTVDGSGIDFNVSYTRSITTGNSVSCTIALSSPSTANSSATTTYFNVTNSTSRNALNVNFTLASTDLLEDSNDYTVAATCWNTTTAIAATSSTGVTVSRTTPSAPTTTQATNSILANNAVLTYTVTGTDTTGCRIAFLPSGSGIRFTGTNTFAMTHSGNSCTYTATSANVPDSDYNIYVQASDGVDTAQSSALTVKFDAVKSGSSAGAYVVQQQAAQKKNNNTLLIIGALALAYYFRKDLGLSKK